MKHVLVISTLVLIIAGCWKDDIDPSVIDLDLTSDWVIPAIRTKFDIKDIDEEVSFIRTQPDGRMELHFREDSVIQQEATEYFDLPPDQPVTPSFAVRALGALTLDFVFAVFGDAGLNSMTLFEGDLVYNFKQSYPIGTTVTFSINNATLNGQPAVFDFEVTSSSSSGRINVDGLAFDFNTTSGSNRMSYTVELTSSDSLGLNDPVEFTWNFENISLEVVEGYFGKRVVTLPPLLQPIDFGGLERFEGLITLYKPELKVTIHNPLGLGFKVIPAIAGIKSGQAPQIINLPVIQVDPATAPGTSTTSTIVFNANNSDVLTLLQSIPEELFLQGSIIVNDDEDSTLVNFATRYDMVTIDLELIIPLEFSTQTITLTQNITEVPLFESLPLDINRLELDFRTENKFPFLAELEIYFMDDNNTQLDSVSLSVLQPANVDNTGRVINPVSYNDNIVLDEKILDILPLTSYFEVRVRLGTTDDGSVPVVIYDDYTFETLFTFKVGLNSYQVNTNDDE